MKISVGKKGIEILIDKQAYLKLRNNGYRFYVGTDNYIYARKYVGYVNKKNVYDRKGIHRFITNAPKGMDVDHINGNIHDNRKSNLRICTRAQNNINTRGKNKYKGVSYDKKNKRWKVVVTFQNKQHWVGRFQNQKDAAIAYNNKAKVLHGEFARLNKIII